MVIADVNVWREGRSGDIKGFSIRFPSWEVTQARKAIMAFRAYHYFYRVDPANRDLQIDVVPKPSEQQPPPRPKAWVQYFAANLPRVSPYDLVVDDRKYTTCLGAYEDEPSSTGKPEYATKLPCGHVLGILGTECLPIMLISKTEGGWAFNRCSLCKATIYEADEEAVRRSQDINGEIYMQEALAPIFPKLGNVIVFIAEDIRTLEAMRMTDFSLERQAKQR